MHASAYMQAFSSLLASLEVDQAAGEEGKRVGLSLDEGAALATRWLANTVASSRRVLAVGNGGSASICGHILMDLSNASGVRTLTFHDYPMLTALANDHGYEAAYARCVSLWAEPGDVLIAISSSGRSSNILQAVHAARHCGARIVTLSGFRADNPLRASGDLSFFVPSDSYGFVEMAHAVLAHCLCEATTLHLGKPAFGRLPAASGERVQPSILQG